jgi:hypothetical protein
MVFAAISTSLVLSIVTVVALALALAQTLLSLRQGKMSNAQLERLTQIKRGHVEQTQHLADVSDSMATQTLKLGDICQTLSTKYLNAFPQYVPKIAELIDTAQHDLAILCTQPAHAVFSNNQGWWEMKQALERAVRRDVKIDCIFGTPESRRELIAAQFADALHDETSWRAWRDDPENQKRLRVFLDCFAIPQNPADVDRELFQEMFEQATLEDLNTTFRSPHVSVGEIDSHMPLFLWIADGRTAVFATSSLVPVFVSQAFWTPDQILVDAFMATFREFTQRARPPHRTRLVDLTPSKEMSFELTG